MERFLAILLLLHISLTSPLHQLQQINQQIAYLQQINYLLTQRRHALYNYSDLPTDHPIPLQSNKSSLFSQELRLESSHPSGEKSTIFFLKNNLYNTQMFPNHTRIYYQNGTLAAEIEASILFMTIVKATIQYQLCYLETSLMTKCGIFEDNVSAINFRDMQLQNSTPLKLEKIRRYHVQKYEGVNLHSLLFQDGEIRVYDGIGAEKPVFRSNCHTVVKYLDHNPYPMIVGTDKISFLEPFKASEASLGCPVIEGKIITAEVETPFSNTFYLLTTTEIVVMQYSLKKSDRHCKISHRIPISSPSPNLKMFYPTLLFNDSFINITDTLTPPQLSLPIPLCRHNQYQTQYRNSEYFLLHRCCTDNNCTSNLYSKSKKGTGSSSKHFKYIVFLVIFGVVALKFWNKKQSAEVTGFQQRKQQEEMDMDPMVKYQKKMHKEKMKKAQSM